MHPFIASILSALLFLPFLSHASPVEVQSHRGRDTSSQDAAPKGPLKFEKRYEGGLQLPPRRIDVSGLEDAGYEVLVERAVPWKERSENSVSAFTLPIHSQFGSRPASRHASWFLRNTAEDPTLSSAPASAPLHNLRDLVHLVPVSFGSQTFLSLLDTGSADSWLVGTGFTCMGVMSNMPEPASKCRFGPTFDAAQSPTFEPIPEHHLNTSYADGEWLNGRLGTETVTLGNVVLARQIVAIVDTCAWDGDGLSSGLLGLAFRAITRAFAGPDPARDAEALNVHYDPVMTTVFRDPRVDPVFSLALNRPGEPEGALAIGGLPPGGGGGALRWAERFATAPLEVLSILPRLESIAQGELTFYAITVDGVHVEREGYIAHPLQVIVDSGTTLTYLPPDFVKLISGAFEPPAVVNPWNGQWYVDCGAVAPRMGVIMNGTVVYIDPADLLIQTGGVTVDGKPECISGVQAGSVANVLGDVFLKSVVAVFDIGAGEMRFSERVR